MPDKEDKTYRQLITSLRNSEMDIRKNAQGFRAMEIRKKENFYNLTPSPMNISLGIVHFR